VKRLGEAVTEHPTPGTLVAALRGEVDVTNAEELVGQVAAEATNEVERLVLDLSELSFLDSSGIRALIGLVRRVQARGALAVAVVPEGAPVERIFEITRMEELVPLVRSREEALGTP
jgi:anti-sigma B factor antagonist